VFPANIKNAVEGLSVEGLPTWWALYAAEVISWPFARAKAQV
jgi:hypothetical protein